MRGRLGWDDERPERRDEHFDETYDEAEDPGVTLVPQTPGQWAIALAVLALLVGGLGGVYWNSVSRQAAADEAISAAMARLTAASQSDNTPQSLGAALRDEMPMSGRYPVGPDGKLQRPKDAQKPELPSEPENMRFESQEGMEAFSKYFVELLPYTWLSGSTKELKAISSPNCNYCTDFINQSDEVTKNGGWVESSTITVVSMTDAVLADEQHHLWRIDLKILVPSMHAYNGNRLVTSEEITTLLRLQAQFADGKWVVDAVNTEEVAP